MEFKDLEARASRPFSNSPNLSCTLQTFFLQQGYMTKILETLEQKSRRILQMNCKKLDEVVPSRFKQKINMNSCKNQSKSLQDYWENLL